MSLELKEASVSFGEDLLFSNFNLKVSAGDSVVIVGPSGTGKSTILKVFAGLVPLGSGRVLIDDKEPMMLSAKDRSRLFKRMGMLFQKNALFDSLSVADNIRFPLEEEGEKNKAEIEETVDYFLDAVDISHAKNLFPHEISGGMQKRLGIARSLALNPSVIFYDDPTAGLDPITSRRIIKLILGLREKNAATIITVTNDMRRAYQLAGKVVFCFDKDLVVTGNEAETKNHSDARVQQFVSGNLEGPLSFESQH